MTERHGILALGNLLVDHTLLIPAYPAESMLVPIERSERHCGGGCTNVLFNLAVLDPELPRYLAGAIGDDDDGRFIRAQAAARDIDCRAVLTFDHASTSFTDVMISRDNGSRTFFHHLGAMADYSIRDLHAIRAPAKIAHIAYLPLLPGLLPDLIPALQHLRAQGCQISADLVSLPDKTLFARHIRPALPHLDHLIINDIEAALLLDHAGGEDGGTLLAMAEQLLALGVRQTVILHSAQSAAAIRHNGERAIQNPHPIAPENIVSTLGAGDAFCSGALYGLHQNRPLAETLALGHALARFNLASLSATDGAVSLAALKPFLET